MQDGKDPMSSLYSPFKDRGSMIQGDRASKGVFHCVSLYAAVQVRKKEVTSWR